MDIRVYSVYDKKAVAFATPFFQATDEVAQRSFLTAIRNGEGSFGAFPEDYSLYYLGEFDQIDGKLKTLKHGPKEILTGLTAVALLTKSTEEDK